HAGAGRGGTFHPVAALAVPCGGSATDCARKPIQAAPNARNAPNKMAGLLLECDESFISLGLLTNLSAALDQWPSLGGSIHHATATTVRTDYWGIHATMDRNGRSFDLDRFLPHSRTCPLRSAVLEMRNL